MASLNTIKNWFKTGLKPNQLQFWDTWDSFWHKDDIIPATKIENLNQRFNEKADTEAFEGHLTNLNSHQNLFDLKAEKVHQHTINDIQLLGEALSGKQTTLREGSGIEISNDNVISVVAAGQTLHYGSFQIFKALSNSGAEIEPGDVVRGFISSSVLITGRFIGGDTMDINSYNIIDQIDLETGIE